MCEDRRCGWYKSGDFTDRVYVRGPTEIRGNENSKILEWSDTLAQVGCMWFMRRDGREETEDNVSTSVL